MRATNWEFSNRALVFGLIFGLAFPLYSVDHENSTAVLANWLAPRIGIDADLLTHLLFALAAFLLVLAALIRTWASAFLHATVVYASEVKTASLVADGPYRRVRNPLYLGNIVMAFGMGAMMSRSGLVVSVVAIFVFCYRLILREESDLQASQGEQYERYRRTVPRLLPALRPRIPSGGNAARWAEGFKAESWCWGFAAAVVAFAITLSMKAFFGIMTASILLLWLTSALLEKKASSRA